MWIADGKTSAEISRLIGCATATVERHKRNVLDKFEAPNSAAMVAKALRGKIIE
ncbi:LuxR C-terminal-related transcriptional regulator [Rhizobium sp. YTUHZ044]|uniref:LuxR C-terminal-related transcriptional regulator n=1 Tax=Rhizobium sp. YTUHZ044 TaxID=2962678 RepID=UPI003DA9BB3F